MACGLGRLGYDHNLLHLQAQGIESVDLEQKLLNETDQNASFALSIADSQAEVLARKERFLRLPSVKQVEEIASRFPDQIEQKRPHVEAIRQRLAGSAPAGPQDPGVQSRGPAPWSSNRRSMAGAGPEAAELAGRIGQLGPLLEQLSPSEVSARLSAYQQRAAEELLAMLRGLQAVANPEPPHLADLPESLVVPLRQPERPLLAEGLQRRGHLGHADHEPVRGRGAQSSIRGRPAIRSRSTRPRGKCSGATRRRRFTPC